jgi:hypothetical protein
MPYKTLTQMTKNMLDPVRGWWDERQLSRVCPIAGDQAAIDNTLAGMVGYLDGANRFVPGSGAAVNDSRNKMPLFARGGGLDNDAVRYEGNLASQRATLTQGTPAVTGAAPLAEVGISCLVGTGAYELGTTAYQGTIAAGDLLMASTSTAFDATNTAGTAGRGKLAAFVPSGGAVPANSLYTRTASLTDVAVQNSQIVGIATSAAGVRNQYGTPMLYFYVNWWPAI